MRSKGGSGGRKPERTSTSKSAPARVDVSGIGRGCVVAVAMNWGGRVNDDGTVALRLDDDEDAPGDNGLSSDGYNLEAALPC